MSGREAPRPPQLSQASFIPTLRESRPEAGAITTAIASAHAAGAKVEWATFFAGTGAKRVPLPTYPFQRQRYWLDSPIAGAGDASAIGQAAAEHPLLGGGDRADPSDGGPHCSPAASRSPPIPGWPTTPSAARSSCPAPPSSSWR